MTTKPLLSKILAVCLHFLFIFKYFFFFCNLILEILRQTSFLVKKPFVSFCFVKKIELLRFVSRETSDVLLSTIPTFLFHVKQQQNPKHFTRIMFHVKQEQRKISASFRFI